MHPIERLRFVARAGDAPEALLVRETASALSSFCDEPAALVTACQRVVARQPDSALLAWFCSRVLTAIDPSTEIWEAVGALEADPTAARLAAALAPDASLAVFDAPGELGDALVRRGDLRVRVIESSPAPVEMFSRRGSGALVERLSDGGLEVVAVPAIGVAQAVDGVDVVVIEARAAGPGEVLAAMGSLAGASVAAHRGIEVWAVVPHGRLLAAAVWPRFVERALPEPKWDAAFELVPAELLDRVVRPQGEASVADALGVPDAPGALELFGGDLGGHRSER